MPFVSHYLLHNVSGTHAVYLQTRHSTVAVGIVHSTVKALPVNHVAANLTPCKKRPHPFPKCPLIVHYRWKEYSLPCSLHMSVLKSSHKRATHTIFLFCSWSHRNTVSLSLSLKKKKKNTHSLPTAPCRTHTVLIALTLTQRTVLYSQYKARRQVLD